jgi:NADPH:quinone reductase-like Zn-dependent oxidoreductase
MPPATMRVVVLDRPGPPEALSIHGVPVPTPEHGWVLIEVKLRPPARSAV